jgi:integral membrane sensor domain MASE1
VYGFYAGVMINFPTWLFMTVYAGWPYRATWHITLVLIVLAVISGALTGLVYDKVGDGQATA